MISRHGRLISIHCCFTREIFIVERHGCVVDKNIEFSLLAHEVLHKIPHWWLGGQVQLNIQNIFLELFHKDIVSLITINAIIQTLM